MVEKNYGKNWEIISWKYSFNKCQIYNGLKITSCLPMASCSCERYIVPYACGFSVKCWIL